MEAEVLNVDHVGRKRVKLGLTAMEIILALDVARTAGYAMLRDGTLPKDPVVKKRVLKKLANILGSSERQLIQRLVAKDLA